MQDNTKSQLPRPPIVVVLGHVDHGKTTLLDTLRKSNIAAAESGAITQKIGAYEIQTKFSDYDTSKITFIDTPGHEAFDKLRTRGASIADIALLIIDASESIKPQTIDSIKVILDAKIPFIVVLNKTDLPTANVDKVQKDLLRHHVIVESMGGKILAIPISAKTGNNIDNLLEAILLTAHELHLTYSPQNELKGVVLETQKSKAGSTVSCLILDGTLRVGDTVFFENQPVKVKALTDDIGKLLKSAEPSLPVLLLGAQNLPLVGTLLTAQSIEKIENNQDKKPSTPVFDFSTPDENKKLRLLIKADNQGSLEAILGKLSGNDQIEILKSEVGDIATDDVFFAATSGSIIIGFNVKPDSLALKKSVDDKVVIKTYKIIYEMLEELAEVSELFKAKQEAAKRLYAEAKIIAEFVVEGEKIAGVAVTKGQLENGDTVEVYRNNEHIFDTKLVSLKQRAKSLRSIPRGEEGGVVFSPPLDFQIGDMIKSYRI